MDFFRDSIWQFLGTIVGLLGIGISIYIFRKQRERKQILCEVLSNSSVVSVSSELKTDIRIHYKKRLAQDIRLIIVRVENTGDSPVPSSDFEGPIKLSFGQKSEVLDFEIVNANPKSLNPEVINNSNNLIIEPLLLNPGDTFQLKIIALRVTNGVEVEGRILGVKDITKTILPPNFWEAFPWFAGLLLSLIGIALVSGSIIIYTIVSTLTTREPPSFRIHPDECNLSSGEEFPISLSGSNLPADGVISWVATKGDITPPTGFSVIYTAPEEPGTYAITAILEVDGVQSSAKALTCTISFPESDTNGTPTPTVSSP